MADPIDPLLEYRREFPALEAEELEAVIAPGISANHNETLVSTRAALEAEELEAVIAPGTQVNHNETFVGAPTTLEAEELEAVIAPGQRAKMPSEARYFAAPIALKSPMIGKEKKA